MIPKRSVKRVQRKKTSILAAVAALLLVFPAMSGASPTSVGLGTAGAYSVLAGSTITNVETSDTLLKGSLGLHDGTDVTGFTFSTIPGLGVVEGEVNIANAAALAAKGDLTAAYGDAASRTLTSAPVADLAGLTLLPGVHGSASSLLLSGTVTLDAQGDPTAVFIIQAATAELTIASGASVLLIGDAQACNVFWQVGSSATLGTGASFVGTIMADQSISLATGAIVEGRVLARIGAVTFDDNTVFQPGCDLDGDEDEGEGTGEIPDTGAGLVFPVLIGGLALLVAGGGTIVVAKRRRPDLQ